MNGVSRTETFPNWSLGTRRCAWLGAAAAKPPRFVSCLSGRLGSRPSQIGSCDDSRTPQAGAGSKEFGSKKKLYFLFSLLWRIWRLSSLFCMPPIRGISEIRGLFRLANCIKLELLFDVCGCL